MDESCPLYFKNFITNNAARTKAIPQIGCYATSCKQTPVTIAMSQNKTVSARGDMTCGWWKCGLRFESLDLLANHVTQVHATSEPSGLFYCRWEGCARNNRGFNARYKMLVHIRTHTNEKPHRCCQCHKSFSRAENLKIHSRSHSGEKPYLCSVPGCNKAYSNSSDRFKHTRTHQVEKPYLCKIPGCLKRYTDPSSLRKHIKTYNHQQNEVVRVDITQYKLTSTGDSSPSESGVNVTENTSGNNICAENIINNHTCSRACCLKTCLTKAAELLKLGGANMESVTWNMLIEPLIQQSKLRYADDIDIPLDLTVQRK
ncbi:sugarbabe [Carabus blaptoides fortunei]